jgi:hypothetical protein
VCILVWCGSVVQYAVFFSPTDVHYRARIDVYHPHHACHTPFKRLSTQRHMITAIPYSSHHHTLLRRYTAPHRGPHSRMHTAVHRGTTALLHRARPP